MRLGITGVVLRSGNKRIDAAGMGGDLRGKKQSPRLRSDFSLEHSSIVYYYFHRTRKQVYTLAIQYNH